MTTHVCTCVPMKLKLKPLCSSSLIGPFMFAASYTDHHPETIGQFQTHVYFVVPHVIRSKSRAPVFVAICSESRLLSISCDAACLYF